MTFDELLADNTALRAPMATRMGKLSAIQASDEALAPRARSAQAADLRGQVRAPPHRRQADRPVPPSPSPTRRLPTPSPHQRAPTHGHPARSPRLYGQDLTTFTDLDVLAIDDLGLMPLRSDESGDLYELIRLRYERRATIITSNRAVAEWPAVFGAPMLASVAVDRLRHQANVFEIDGPSHRDPRAHIAPRR